MVRARTVRTLINSAGAAGAGQHLGEPLLHSRLESLTPRKSKAKHRGPITPASAANAPSPG